MSTLVKRFNYCGGTQTFTMPEGFASDVEVYMWGAGGGAGGSDGNGPGGSGGAGFYLHSTINVSPGDTVKIAAGGPGLGGRGSTGGGGGAAGGSYHVGVFNSRNPPSGSQVYFQSNGAYCSFLNRYGVWEANGQAGSFDRSYTINFPVTGYYLIQSSCDNYGYVYIDGTQVLYTPGFTSVSSASVYVTAGNHTVRTLGINTGGPASMATLISSGTLGGGPGGAAGPSGWSGGGGGGGGSSVVIVNGTIVACAAGGAGAGGGSHYAGGYQATGEVATGGSSAGGNCPGDGGGGGGGGGGLTPGNGGEYGYDRWRGGLAGYAGTSTSGAVIGNTGRFTHGTDSGYWTPPVAASGAIESTTGGNGGPGMVVLVFTSTGSGKVKVANQWRSMYQTSVKVDGSWRPVKAAWVKQNGQWRQIATSSPSDIATTFSNADFG